MNSTVKRLFSITFLCALGILAFYLRALYPIFLFPIYPDEVAERLAISRFLYDFPIKTDLMPMCKIVASHYSKIWYLPSLFEWLIHGRFFNLITLRLFSIITSWGIFLLLTYVFCKKSIREFKPLSNKLIFILIGLSFILSLMQIGVVPFFLVTMRSEPFILIWLILFLLMFRDQEQSQLKKILLICGFFISIPMLLFLHPKTLLLIPILLVIGLRIFSNIQNKAIFISLCIGLIGLLFWNFLARQFTLDCSASFAVTKLLAEFTIHFQNLTQHFSTFFAEIIQSILAFKTIIVRIIFQRTAQINYLPPIDLTLPIRIINWVLFFNYICIFTGVMISSGILYSKDLAQHKIITKNFLTLTLLFCILISFIFTQAKTWYDAGYIWSLLVVTFIFFITDHLPYLLKQKFTYLFLSYFLLVGSVSLYCFIHLYELPLKKGFAGPGISLAHYNYFTTTQNLNKLSVLCHIDIQQSKYLIIDDATYFYFQQAPYPLAFTYLFYANDQHFLRHFLEKFPADGLIIRSKNLPKPLIATYAHQVGDFVCVPKENLSMLFGKLVN